MSFCLILFFQKIFLPSENEVNDKGFLSVCGTIWSMCFISKDLSQQSEEDNPLFAVVLNRYTGEIHLQEKLRVRFLIS